MGNPATTPPANTATSTPRIVKFGLFELELRTHELRKKGLKIKLQEQPCHILAILLERPGELVTREELRNALWPSDTFVDFNHSLNSAIMRLREVLGDSSENPRFIETVARRGYRFIAPVDCVPDAELEEHSEPAKLPHKLAETSSRQQLLATQRPPKNFLNAQF